MIDIPFGWLSFKLEGERVFLSNSDGALFPFVEVQVAGEDRSRGAKMVHSSEGERFKYLRHSLENNRLEIIQASELVKAKTVLIKYEDTNAIRIYTEVTNISGEDLVLTEVSSFVLGGIGSHSVESSKDLYFTRFIQSHHGECQPRKYSFFDLGIHRGSAEMQKRIFYANIGSWSTKAELPQGIIENGKNGEFIMYQIERNHSWYYEISDLDEEYYLYLGGANETYGDWCKKLLPDGVYRTASVALTFGNSENGVIGEMTKYRRHIFAKSQVDANLPTIFNEYMHLSWDSPTAENTRKVAPVVAKTGVEYYVIDCGWHNEEPGDIIYPYVGQWVESKARFPEGVRKTTDFIRSLGMKAGLWIEPEIIGCKCREMLEYYDEDCFLQRHGKRLSVMGRHFLDFRAKKVVDYMSETIRRMVEDYGADYIKMDYNQDCGTGTDYMAFTAGEGLEQSTRAYLKWVVDMQKRFPEVLFETCSSGGMRMDYETLSHFPIISTSDNISYLRYPEIAGNILSAVLPEQAAVWSYPVDTRIDGVEFEESREWVDKNIFDEQVIMNMINSFLGRMHLASHLELLDEEKLELVKEGVEYFGSFAEEKKIGLPYFPLGFTSFDKELVACGIKTDGKLYLAVWNLSPEAAEAIIPLSEVKATDAHIAYPKNAKTDYSICENGLKISFESGKIARFFELEI